MDTRTHYQNVDVAKAYDTDRFGGIAGNLFNRLEKRTIRRAIRYCVSIARDPKVLDIPCGTGRITQVLLDSGLSVVGGDISREMIDVAKSRLARYETEVSFKELDLESLDLSDASYDIVTCIRLFHHLHSEQRARILKEISRVTSTFVVITMSYSSKYYRFRRRIKRALSQGVSNSSSTREEIQREIKEADLEIVWSSFVLPFASEGLVLVLRKSKL